MFLLSAPFHIVYTSWLQLPSCTFFPNINTHNLPLSKYKTYNYTTKWGTKNIYQITSPPTNALRQKSKGMLIILFSNYVQNEILVLTAWLQFVRLWIAETFTCDWGSKFSVYQPVGWTMNEWGFWITIVAVITLQTLCSDWNKEKLFRKKLLRNV